MLLFLICAKIIYRFFADLPKVGKLKILMIAGIKKSDDSFAILHRKRSTGRSLMGILCCYFISAVFFQKDEANELFRQRIRIVHLQEGQKVYEQGSIEGPALVMVISGLLQMAPDLKSTDENGREKQADFDPELNANSWKAFIHAHELICSCGLQLLANEPAVFTISAFRPSTVALVERTQLEAIVAQMPEVVLPIAYSVLRRVSPFLRAIDFAIDWVLLDSGETVYR